MYKNQKGSGDSGTLLIVFGACCVMSVLLIVFNWMGDTMQARRDSRGLQDEAEQGEQIHEPFGYEVVYSRNLTGFSQE